MQTKKQLEAKKDLKLKKKNLKKVSKMIMGFDLWF